VRALDLHQEVFGVRPRGVWPSEGSVSEEALAIAHSLGVKWMATTKVCSAAVQEFSFSATVTGGCPRI